MRIAVRQKYWLPAGMAVVFALCLSAWSPAATTTPAFFATHCISCHDADTKKGNLDLTALKSDLDSPENFATWVKVHDRIASGEMPPAKKPRPEGADLTAVTAELHQQLLAADRKRLAGEGRTGIRRLTRFEYENTLRDLFDMPAVPLANDLPSDGSAHGFDNNADALDISHVNLAKYIETADRLLDLAIARQPTAPTVQKQRISLANPGGFVGNILLNGDAVLLRNKQPDPAFPPAGDQRHIDLGAHTKMGFFRGDFATVGIFRHEDESVNPYFIEFIAIYPGRYRIKTSLWSFQWDKGKVLPARGTEAARLSIVQLTGDGRGGQHPSYVLGYYDAPSLTEQEHELVHWLNPRETIGFNAASLAPVANYSRKGRAMAFTGPGIACDYLEVEGPLNDVWPPRSHRVLFGDLPIQELKPSKDVRLPARKAYRQELGAGHNKGDVIQGTWTVASASPAADADRLLAEFLPKLFRRPVSDDVRKQYVALATARLAAGDCFETAMRFAYRAALCSPDFLYRVEPPKNLDGYALASRLSYFLWNAGPDDRLRALANDGSLLKPDVLQGEVDRLLADPRSRRFVEDFVGQWLKLRAIAANDPDKKLYPEFSPYLQDSMVAETRAYFRALIDRDLPATNLVKSDFVMVNQKLAAHYGIPGVVGSQIRPVPLPPGCPRGGFLTQAAILKVSANGTTTSPVTRGAFVQARIMGQPPEPPPPNVPAVEPDVRGATTIREMLDKHRSNATCASCHAKIDPPGFAMESFDVIGGYRERYRSIGDGDPAPRGQIDPFIGISFKLGPKVDASGQTPQGKSFAGMMEFQQILAADESRLLKNLAEQFAVYSTGRAVAYSDREAIDAVVAATQKKGGGVKTLIRELVGSELFKER